MTPRGVALGLGVAYVALTAMELVIGNWTIGDVVLLERTTKANLLHWGVALAMLGGFFGGQGASRTTARVVGLILLALAIWGLVAAESLGSILGYSEGIPLAYNLYHGLAALIALSGGFLRGSA